MTSVVPWKVNSCPARVFVSPGAMRTSRSTLPFPVSVAHPLDAPYPDRIQRLGAGVLSHHPEPLAVEVAVGERDDVGHRPEMLV